MNKFELYCMIFYVLDAEWDETNDPQLGEFLSGANPFLFEDIGSADPAIFAQFCEAVTSPITVENSHKVASEYVVSLENEAITKAFASIDEAEWIECVKDYLSEEHKGGEAQ